MPNVNKALAYSCSTITTALYAVVTMTVIIHIDSTIEVYLVKWCSESDTYMVVVLCTKNNKRPNLPPFMHRHNTNVERFALASENIN